MTALGHHSIVTEDEALAWASVLSPDRSYLVRLMVVLVLAG
jgi:hypothetical protein